MLILFTARWIRRSTDRSLKERANMVTMLQKSIEGIRIVKAFVMEDQQREQFDAANTETFRYDMRGARAKSMVQPVVEVLSAIFVVVFLLLGPIRPLRRSTTQWGRSRRPSAARRTSSVRSIMFPS